MTARERVAGANASAEHPLPGAIATSMREAGKPECYDLSSRRGLLRRERNVLAIAGVNDSPSSDMSLLSEVGTLPFVCHTDFRLPSEGGEVILRDRHGRVVDRVRYPELEKDRSWGRRHREVTEEGSNPGDTPAAGEWSYFVTPTPGEANRTQFHRELLAGTFRFDPLPGSLAGTRRIRVVLEDATPGVTVGLSTDGRSPLDPRGDRMEGVPFDRDLLLRAAAFFGSERLFPLRSGGPRNFEPALFE